MNTVTQGNLKKRKKKKKKEEDPIWAKVLRNNCLFKLCPQVGCSSAIVLESDTMSYHHHYFNEFSKVSYCFDILDRLVDTIRYTKEQVVVVVVCK